MKTCISTHYDIVGIGKYYTTLLLNISLFLTELIESLPIKKNLLDSLTISQSLTKPFVKRRYVRKIKAIEPICAPSLVIPDPFKDEHSLRSEKRKAGERAV